MKLALMRRHALPLMLLASTLHGCAPVAPKDLEAELALTTLLTQCQGQLAEIATAATAGDEALQEALVQVRAELGSLATQVQACEKEVSPPAPTIPDAVAVVVEKETEKLVVGRLEDVWIEDLQLALPARIDTGAETASMDARNITPFERDGKPWVRFEIRNPKGEELLVLERRLVREALVVQSNSDEPERRPVIRLGIQLGPVRQLAEFTLSDRSHLDHQILVGRNILRDVMLVDVSGTNLVRLPDKKAMGQ